MKCHGNLNAGKMSHRPGQTRLLEDLAVDTLVHSSFGTVVMLLFPGLFTAPSWHTCTALACGWALATDRHTITTSLWLTGATAVIRLAAPYVPEGEVIRVVFDATTKQKASTHIEGLGRYRPGAGSARQASRTRRGLNCVLGLRRIPLTCWPGPSLSVPVGLALSLQPDQAHALNVPYRARRQLARDLLDVVSEQLPGRPRRSLADSCYNTKDYVRQFPEAAHVVGRLPRRAKLYAARGCICAAIGPGIEGGAKSTGCGVGLS